MHFVFPRFPKSLLHRSMFFIFLGVTVLLLGTHSHACEVHDGLFRPIRLAASIRNKAAPTWLHVWIIPAIQMQ